MEQKQLDELDESYFEEFVDDDPLADVKITPAKIKTAAKRSTPKKTRVTKVKEEPIKNVEEIKVETVKEETKPIQTKEDQIEITPVKPVEETVKETVKAKEPSKFETTTVETAPTHDPWGDEEPSDDGFFKEASTWKAITGLIVVLLVFSVFTQGFQFATNEGVTGAVTTDSITLSEAEAKVLDYVNANLLQPPFTAILVNSADEGELYRVTLNVAGQSVDSFLSKDGKMFYPQGFDLEATSLEDELSVKPVVEVPVVEEPVVEEKATVEESPSEVEAPIVEVPVVEEVAPVELVNTVNLQVNARKWLFEPDTLKVKQGDKVVLKVAPSGLDFTFAIAGLGVSQEVSGETTVEFIADKAGTFDLTCSSCEDWRGMSGTLLVE